MTFNPSGMKQGYHQWYAARYFGKDEQCAEALRVLMDKLVEKKTYKAFISDFTQNLHIVVSELSDPEYYEKCDENINLKDYHLLGTYDRFVGYKKSRLVLMEKIVPTWAQIEKKEVICVKDGDVIRFEHNKVETPVSEMKSTIIDYLKGNNEGYKLQDKKKEIFVSEITQKPYPEVEGKELRDLQAEKTSAEVVVKFIEKMKENVVDPDYRNMLQKSLTSKKNEIPVSYVNEDGKKDYVHMVLPKITKHFMNKEHLLNTQDIAEAVVNKYKLTGSDKTSLVLRQEFLEIVGNTKVEEMPPNILFNPSWLELISFEKIKDYCPVFTGYKSSAWILKRVDGYPGCINKDTFKLILTMVLKMAKFYGLWVRGGLKCKALSNYITQMLKLTPRKVYGFVLHHNVEEWMQPLIIEKFKESSLFTVKEDMDIFDDGVDDGKYDEIFEGYTGPDFEPDEEKKLDRDKGELDEQEKPKRGSNNKGVQRAFKKERDRKIKKKKKKSDNKNRKSSDSQEDSEQDSVSEQSEKKKKTQKVPNKEEKDVNDFSIFDDD